MPLIWTTAVTSLNALRRRYLTMEEVIREGRRLTVDLTGLKA